MIGGLSQLENIVLDPNSVWQYDVEKISKKRMKGKFPESVRQVFGHVIVKQ